MGTFFFIDYIVSFFILLAIDAPRWAWFVYAGSALFWFVVWALSGNDFEAQRHITRENFDDENLSITTIYFPAKCPKCGNWATTPETIQQYKVPCTED